MTSNEKSGGNQIGPHVRSTQASGPSSILLTTVPIQSLQEEFHQLLEMCKRFEHITYILYYCLREDRPTDHMRKVMQPFLHAMYLATESIAESFRFAQEFYKPFGVSNWPQTLDQAVTDEDIRKFSNTETQRRMLKEARAVIKGCRTTSCHLQVAIPLLPYIEDGMSFYLKDYKGRHALAQRRAQSWLAEILHMIHGKQDAPLLVISDEDVEQVSNDLAVGSVLLLQNLPAFVDRWRIHFSQLCEICQDPRILKELGYGEADELKRLYADRSICAQYIDKMQHDWAKFARAFMDGDPEMVAFIARVNGA